VGGGVEAPLLRTERWRCPGASSAFVALSRATHHDERDQLVERLPVVLNVGWDRMMVQTGHKHVQTVGSVIYQAVRSNIGQQACDLTPAPRVEDADPGCLPFRHIDPATSLLRIAELTFITRE